MYSENKFTRHYITIGDKVLSLYDLAGYKDNNKMFIYNYILIDNLKLFNNKNENEYNKKELQEKYLNLSLLDVACEFGNFELAYFLVKNFNFDYEKEDLVGITPYLRAFASIYQNDVDDELANKYFILFFEEIEKKIKENNKDSSEEVIIDKIRKLYNWNIPYFSIINDADKVVSKYKYFYENPYFKPVAALAVTTLVVYGGIILIGSASCTMAISAYLNTFISAKTAALIISGGIVYYFELDKFVDSNISLNVDIIFDQSDIKKKMDSIGFNSNFNVENYKKNIYKVLKKYNKELGEFLENQNNSHIFTSSEIFFFHLI